MATLSSKVTPSGVATAAQGTLADSAVQPNDSPTFVTLTLTDQLEVENASPSIRLRETDFPNAQHRIIASNGGLYIQAEDADGTTDGDLYLTGMNSQDARLIDMRAATVTMTNDLEVTGDVQAATFTGDGSALTGVGGSTTAGDVGTYAFVARASSTAHSIGDTVAGSNLFAYEGYYSGITAGQTFSFGGTSTTTTFSGTWRWVSEGAQLYYKTRAGLAVRIS